MAAALRDKRYAWIAGGLAAVAVLALGLLGAPLTRPLDAYLYDRAQRHANVIAAPEIVIVSIDAESQRKLGPWPWPRTLHASLLQQLAGAKVVAFTTPLDTQQDAAQLEHLRTTLQLLRSEQSRGSQTAQAQQLLDSSLRALDDDTQLANAMLRQGNVIVPISARLNGADQPGSAQATLLKKHFIEAVPEAVAVATAATDLRLPSASIVAAAAGIGHTMFVPDDDQTLRQEITAVRVQDQLVPSLALAIAAQVHGPISFDTAKTLRLPQTQIPLEPGLRLRPQYLPARSAYSHYSYWQVLAGQIPAAQFQDKLVLVGMTEGEETSSFATPLQERVGDVQVTADALSSLLHETFYRRPAWSLALQTAIAVIGLALAALGLSSGGLLLGATVAGLFVVIAIVTEIGLLSSAGVWIGLTLPCVVVLAALLAYAAVTRLRQRSLPVRSAAEAAESLRMLGLTFQGQGQLDLAFETFRRCPLDEAMMDLLYRLGLDFERRRQLRKASAVYAHMATFDANYRDLADRRANLEGQPDATMPGWSPGSPSTRPITRTLTAAPDPSKQTLGRYEIERELGKGAMGVVYLGRDPKINRVVAIKAIPLAEEFEEEDLAEARARFFREAEMAGRLNHPGIVTVYDAGEDRGLAYIAMEYLRGEHLSHYAEPQHLLPPHMAMALVARVADALHYAHRQNVVHRDIKPANIMFNAETDELKITDFGIARLTDTSRTKTGIVLGTPSFMSPEQLEGRALDGRSDLFALGVTLYQLLSAQLPFRADSMTRLMQKIATEPHVSLRSYRPELSDRVESIISKALAKDADARYQSGAEFAAALRGAMSTVIPKEAVG